MPTFGTKHLLCIDNYANELLITTGVLWDKIIMPSTYEVPANVCLACFFPVTNEYRKANEGKFFIVADFSH
jgi:hypothetical protein